jgi:hypothetical protein
MKYLYIIILLLYVMNSFGQNIDWDNATEFSSEEVLFSVDTIKKIDFIKEIVGYFDDDGDSIINFNTYYTSDSSFLLSIRYMLTRNAQISELFCFNGKSCFSFSFDENGMLTHFFDYSLDSISNIKLLDFSKKIENRIIASLKINYKMNPNASINSNSLYSGKFIKYPEINNDVYYNVNLKEKYVDIKWKQNNKIISIKTVEF